VICRGELEERLDELTIVDTQHPNMFRRRHLPNAVNLPRGRVEALAAVLLPDLDAEIVVYCGSWLCRSSDRAAEELQRLGYTTCASTAAAGPTGGVRGCPSSGPRRRLRVRCGSST
jgi:rhodanese-related sulfurtransferase